jgi:hypothetical protein
MCKANNAVGNFIFLLGGFSCWANKHEIRKNEEGPREIQKVGEILPPDLYIGLLSVSTVFPPLQPRGLGNFTRSSAGF